tara:strand:- start:922 stop:1413 length:492 start_codon:yes stop_codon:yes gene_type:complete
MSENTCSICLQEYDDDTQTYTLDSCGHKFHTKCIIDWFRRASTCPCCRNNNVENFDNIPAYVLRERAKELRKISRRNNAPSELKRLIDRLKNIEDKLKNKSIDYKEFKKDNKEILAQDKKFMREKWNIQFQKRKTERLIGLFQCNDYPLPYLIVQQDAYHIYR